MSVKEKWARQKLILPFGIASVLLFVVLVIAVNTTYWVISLIWTVGWLGAFWYMGTRLWLPKWPGEEAEFRKGKFCERYEENSLVKQPINTWSNLSFVVAGLVIVLIAGTRQAPARNPMADSASLVPLMYALVVIFLGPGSMFFHASAKRWGGWFDMISMVAWVGYSVSYTVTRIGMYWFNWPLETVWILFVVIVGGIGVYTAVRGIRRANRIMAGQDPEPQPSEQPEEDPSAGLDVIIVLAGVWIVVEVLLMVWIWLGGGPGFRRGTSWFIAALLAFAASFVVWIPSNGEKRFLGVPKDLWCNPDSPYQGHGFWHVFSAIGAVCIYLHFLSAVPM